jgi:hypothetical protein
MRPFENLREQLLNAGIPPRHASRYIKELREHLADLETRERAAGLSPQEARDRALILLGSESQLAQAMIRVAPRSLAARAPWSVLAVMPVLLLILAIAVTGNLMIHVLLPVRGLAPSDMPAGYASLITAVSVFNSYLIGPLLAAGCIVAAVRQRLASGWIWVGLALIALISGFLGFHVHFVPGVNGEQEGILAGGGAVGIVYQDGRPDLAATLGLALLRATLLFAVATFAYCALKARFIHTGSEA